jgi:hypothetical protein
MHIAAVCLAYAAARRVTGRRESIASPGPSVTKTSPHRSYRLAKQAGACRTISGTVKNQSCRGSARRSRACGRGSSGRHA